VETERFPSLSDGTVPVDAATSKEAVMHHALGKK
jgi:hypothetical protein